jgi:mRNA interferase RelE/StbE
LADDPHPRGSIKVKGEDDLWRLRVGDYRVIYHIYPEEKDIKIVAVGHRREAYRSFIRG